MAIKLNAMKNMVYEAAWHYDHDEMTATQAAMCKYYCVNAAFDVVDDAMQVMGGVGVAGDHRIQRIWRDLRGGPGQRRHRRDDDPHRGQGRPAPVRELRPSHGTRNAEAAVRRPGRPQVVYAAMELPCPRRPV